jgi:hypothetical protein
MLVLLPNRALRLTDGRGWPAAPPAHTHTPPSHQWNVQTQQGCACSALWTCCSTAGVHASSGKTSLSG